MRLNLQHDEGIAPFNHHGLIARCGMNCSLCMAWQRVKNKCPGCREPDTGKTISVRQCKIKSCDRSEAEFCYSCNEFPCKRLKHLDKRYRLKYHMSMIENLLMIRNSDMDAFLESETEKWSCWSCGGTICVHKGKCGQCGQ